MTREQSEQMMFTCDICEENQEPYRGREPDVPLCHECWFSFLTGAERKAIAERVQA